MVEELKPRNALWSMELCGVTGSKMLAERLHDVNSSKDSNALPGFLYFYPNIPQPVATSPTADFPLSSKPTNRKFSYKCRCAILSSTSHTISIPQSTVTSALYSLSWLDNARNMDDLDLISLPIIHNPRYWAFSYCRGFSFSAILFSFICHGICYTSRSFFIDCVVVCIRLSQ